jgi:hypothetical protein
MHGRSDQTRNFTNFISMKTFIPNTLFAIVTAAVLFASCSKDPSSDPQQQPVNANNPQIVKFLPATVQSGDTLRIELKNFAQTYTSDTTGGRRDAILIGTTAASVINATQTLVTVAINAQHRSNKLIVVIAKDTAISKDSVIIGSGPGTWQKVSTCAAGNRTNPSVFLFGDTAYYGFGMGFRNGYITGLPDFWKFDLKAGTWTKLSDQAITDPLYSECVSFQNNDKAYISFRSVNPQTWKYTPGTRTWERHSNVYSGSWFSQTTGSSGNTTLIGASENPAANGKSGFISFDGTTGQFSYFADIPDTAKSPIITGYMSGSDFYFGIRQELVNGYYNPTPRFYKLNSTTKLFERKANLPDTLATWSQSYAFAYRGNGYILNAHKLFKYDAVANTWQRKNDFAGFPNESVNYYGSFLYNNAFYVFVYNESLQVTELWKYNE